MALKNLTEAIIKVVPDERAPLYLSWLAKGWSERDPFSKFMSYFISIETLLGSIKESPDITANKVKIANELRELYKGNGIDPERNETFKYIND